MYANQSRILKPPILKPKTKIRTSFNIPNTDFKLTTVTSLAMELLDFGEFVSFYLTLCGMVVNRLDVRLATKNYGFESLLL